MIQRLLVWLLRRVGPSSGAVCLYCGRSARGQVGGREPYHDIVVCDRCGTQWGISRRGQGPAVGPEDPSVADLEEQYQRYKERRAGDREGSA